eukprot:CCRYP_015236-RA/>CCRYP_015236-RA protein AED:0.03 eAED:0.03 QI:354/1/1/1/0/0/7/3741/314
MDIPIRTHRRNVTARSSQAKMTENDHLATKNNSRPPRSPLKRVFGGKRSSSAPARIGRRHLLVEDHYLVDPVDKRLLPGLPVTDEDWARDMHDFFNLVALVPVVVLNFMNWNWDILFDPRSKKNIQQAWSGDWFSPFFAVVIGYFVADLIWVILIPKCVKSPGVIIQHHIATLIYLVIPYLFREDGWLMGACLSVEINTWLLIARRVFNKQGFPPWVIDLPPFVSIRIKLISVLFYVTWISIRCFLYPIIMKILLELWWKQWKQTGMVLYSRYTVGIVLHSIFCILNFKWTFDLFASKLRAWKLGKEAKVEKGL